MLLGIILKRVISSKDINMPTRVMTGQALCEVCRKMSPESLLADEGFEHISNPDLLFASMIKCRMCYLIYHSISNVFSTLLKHPWYNPDSPSFTILHGLERESYGLDHILVYCGFRGKSLER